MMEIVAYWLKIAFDALDLLYGDVQEVTITLPNEHDLVTVEIGSKIAHIHYAYFEEWFDPEVYASHDLLRITREMEQECAERKTQAKQDGDTARAAAYERQVKDLQEREKAFDALNAQALKSI